VFKGAYYFREMIESLEDVSSGLEQRRIHGTIELMKFFDLAKLIGRSRINRDQ